MLTARRPSSNSKSPFVVYAIWNFIGLVQYTTICLKMSPKKLLCVFVLSRLDYCNLLLAGCPKYLLSKLQKVQNNAARLIFRTTRSAHVTPMLHSLHWLPIEQRIKYKLSLLCFNCSRSFLLRLPSTFQNFFTFTLPPGSSSLLQTPKCLEYHPSEQSPVVSTLSLNRLQLSGTNTLFLSTILVSSFKSSLKTFILKTFSSVSLP